jgi:hypothetical protein
MSPIQLHQPPITGGASRAVPTATTASTAGNRPRSSSSLLRQLARAVVAVAVVATTMVAGGQSALANTTVIQDTDAGDVTYSAEWNQCLLPGCPDAAKAPDGSFHWTSTNYADLTIRFNGTSITLFGTKEPWSNIATVSIDGGPPIDVDFYSDPRTESQAVYTSPGLASGEHALVLTKTHRRNPLSGGGDAITFDRAVIVTSQLDASPPAAPRTLTGAAAGAHRIHLQWPDSAEPDIASYTIYRSTTPGITPTATTLLATALTDNHFIDTGLSSTTTYYYLVTANDTSGNQSPASPAAQASTTPAPVVDTIQDTTSGTGVGLIQYSIHWNPCTTTCDKAPDASYMWTGHDGAALTIRFDGVRISLFGVKEPWSNIATISIDGGTPVDVDFYAPVQTDSILVWTSPGLTQGTHTLVMTKTPRRNPGSGGGDAITFDRAWVISTPSA